MAVIPSPVRGSTTARAGRGTTVNAGTGIHQGMWHTYTVPDGLPHTAIYDLHQDTDGALWIATNGGGACRFDGTTFTCFTRRDNLADDNLQAVLEDRQGRLWFATGAWSSDSGNGVSRYDGERFVNFTTQDGLAGDKVRAMLEDRQGRLWFGTTGGVSRYDGEQFVSFTTQEGLVNDDVWAMLEDRQGRLWFGTTGGVSRYDGERFVNFTTQDGLIYDRVWSMLEDRRGCLWFGTGDLYDEAGGLSRYDGERFVDFTTQDGLAGDKVQAMLEDRLGYLWFGTDEGVSRYDGERFVNFTTQDGLANDWVVDILEDEEGNLWFGCRGGMSKYAGDQFATYTIRDGLGVNAVYAILEDRERDIWLGTWGGGLSRYDGDSFTTYTVDDGLISNDICSLLQDSKGNIWFGTREGIGWYDGSGFQNLRVANELIEYTVACMLEDRRGNLWFGTSRQGSSEGDGLLRYDGKSCTLFTTEDGLPSCCITSIHEDENGHLWIGTNRGVTRYDGERFAVFTREDGLFSNRINSIAQDSGGHLWFGGYGGISRYDGERFVTVVARDDLQNGPITFLFQGRDGDLWFATWGGGVGRYDGTVFQSLLRRDGLADNQARCLLEDSEGTMWIGTDAGVTRFRPTHSEPVVRISDVLSAGRHGPVAELSMPSSRSFVAFEFDARSFKTRPEQLIFLYRLKNYQEQWQQTRARRVEYADLPHGNYVFQVRAVDRDLGYSAQPAEVRLDVHLPYAQIAFAGGTGAALLAVVLVSGYALRRRRDLHRAERALLGEFERELRTAHDLQMGLMPTGSPEIPGFEIAGRCLPASHVGGDFFQYYERDGRLSICLADVTGHAMEAAVPVMMFSGVLETEIRHGDPPEKLFRHLNTVLNRKLERRTFVCFVMGELDPSAHKLHLSNGGCPYPYHYQSSTREVVELQLNAYPLGVSPDTRYQTREIQLRPGDRVVFCSDGIIEAENSGRELFGFARTAETIRRGCQDDLSAGQLLDRIIREVEEFTGEAAQGDDQTIVILSVEKE